MIKKVDNDIDANKCDELLTKLILDERKYDDSIDSNIKVTDHFNKMLNDENVILLAYHIDNIIAGYILIRKIENDTCLFDGLYVEELYRNQGIGNSLLNAAIDRCKNMNIKYIDINVMYKNKIAKNIYEKLGFYEFKVKLRKEL